ncbi:nucleotidyltransferase family protein [Candidatus Chloroploca sp. M-50]|uniref:Nucleotidyltransferase family protein n=1 Tax=Candidatus Chloroploca mongolica TaxID=2528176 RepID=A0ABS4DBM5_9CHLR|nr:nucleotidyltransferase family protein [Candidatus Chloroploca mongolica]MBP1466857.1 nucleotidyltransferase family protein [Candidatus Chloroploca mongolica]
MRNITILRQHLPELKQRYQIKSLGLFGSYVRNEQTAQSDVDILVEFEELPGLLTYVALQQTLSDLLHVSVDLVHRPDLRPHLRERILAEVVEV